MDAEAAVRQFYQALNTGDTSLLDDVLHPDWEDIPLPPGVPSRGREIYKPTIAWLRGVLAGFEITHEDIVVSGDRVAVRSVSRGTHSGEMLGIPATGHDVEFRAFDFHRLEDGLIVQTWHLEDFFALYQQISGH
jgi:ketosteroid isomerase-like protein